MTSRRVERAKKLAKEARGNIEHKQLFDNNPSGFFNSSNRYLSNSFFIDYLDEDEQPHWIFYNHSKGVTVDNKTIGEGWISSYAAGMWVTNKGIYFSVVHDNDDIVDGKEDIVEYIPYKKINNVMAKRPIWGTSHFVINARDNKYKFDINQRLFSYIKPARKYIGEKYQDSPSGVKKQPAVESRKDDSRHGGEEITRHDLQTMDEYEFEHLVAETWREMGWNAEVTQSSSDRGVDVIATKETPFRERHLIQAKRYSADNKVGSGEMQKYSGLYSRDEQVDQVIVVTTSSFTSEAKEISSTRDVKTVNGQELLNLVRSETENNT